MFPIGPLHQVLRGLVEKPGTRLLVAQQMGLEEATCAALAAEEAAGEIGERDLALAIQSLALSGTLSREVKETLTKEYPSIIRQLGHKAAAVFAAV